MGNTGEQLLSVPLSLSVYINDHTKWASPEEGLVFTLLDVIEFRFHFTLHSISSLGLQISFHKKFRGTSRDCITFERLFVPHHLSNAIWFHLSEKSQYLWNIGNSKSTKYYQVHFLEYSATKCQQARMWLGIFWYYGITKFGPYSET